MARKYLSLVILLLATAFLAIIVAHRNAADRQRHEEMALALLAHDPQYASMLKYLSDCGEALQKAIYTVKNPSTDSTVKTLRLQMTAMKQRIDNRKSELLPQIIAELKAH